VRQAGRKGGEKWEEKSLGWEGEDQKPTSFRKKKEGAERAVVVAKEGREEERRRSAVDGEVKGDRRFVSLCKNEGKRLVCPNRERRRGQAE